MPPDEKKDGPVEHPTKELPRVDIPSMLTSLAADMKQVLSATDKMSGDVDMLISDGRKTNQRLTRVEERLDDFDGRLARHSGGTRQLSDTDMKHEKNFSEVFTRLDTQDKAIGDVKTAVVTVQAAVAENTFFTKKAITGFAKEHPQLVQAAIGLLMAALGFATSWFSSHGGH